MGLLLYVVVHGADVQDHDGAKDVFEHARVKFKRLVQVWADGGYAASTLGEWVSRFCRFALQIVRRPAKAQGFVLLKRRWIVERTFGWLGRSRRLSKDYEYLPQSSESMIYLTMINLMLQRLAPKHSKT